MLHCQKYFSICLVLRPKKKRPKKNIRPLPHLKTFQLKSKYIPEQSYVSAHRLVTGCETIGRAVRNSRGKRKIC